MSGDTGVQLRRLIARTVDLPRPKPGKVAGPHPLGLGLPKSVAYSGAVPLPSTPGGAARLLAVVAEPLPNVPEAVRELVWGTLLLKPPLQVSLGPCTVDRLLAMDVPASEASIGLFRQVGLAVVANIHPSVAGVPRPMAGVAVLTVRLNPKNARSADEGWLHVQWATSTRSLAHELERLIDLGGAVPRGRKSAVLLVSPELAQGWDQDALGRVQTTATVFGFDLKVYDRSTVTYGDIRSWLTRNSPSLVISFGPHDDAIAELRKAYDRANPGGASLLFTRAAPTKRPSSCVSTWRSSWACPLP